MAINSVTDTSYTRARENLAATGLVVIGVEFRNAGGQARPAPVPGGAQRLRGRDPMGVCQPQGSRHQPPDHLRRVRRRQFDAHHPAQGQAGGLAERDRRRVRAVPVHVGPLVRAARRTPVAEGERRLLPHPGGHGSRGSVYDPTGENSQDGDLLRGVGHRRGAEWPSAACHFGQRDRSAARRGAALLPQAGARGRSRGRPDSRRHRPWLRPVARWLSCPKCSPPPSATSAASRSPWPTRPCVSAGDTPV